VAVHNTGPSAPPHELGGHDPTGRSATEADEAKRRPVRERLGVLGNWRLLGTLIAGGLMLAILLTVAVNSRAYLTVHSTSPDNAFGADQVDIRITTAGQLVDGTGFAPGVTRSGTQTITSYGHRARLTLDATGLTGGALLDVLVVTVRETAPGTTQRYQGSLRDLRGADLGELGAAQAKSFAVTVAWPADRPNPALAGTTVSLDFAWSAESVR
jgi:hypothetical protein